MITEQNIVDLIKALAEQRGWKVSHASRMASGSGDTVDRLQGGIGLTLRRAHAIIQQVSELWPKEADAQWPTDIPRPARKRGAA